MWSLIKLVINLDRELCNACVVLMPVQSLLHRTIAPDLTAESPFRQ